MKLAEELYQAGFISYPRTETDIFSPDMDLQVWIRFAGGWWWLSGVDETCWWMAVVVRCGCDLLVEGGSNQVWMRLAGGWQR